LRNFFSTVVAALVEFMRSNETKKVMIFLERGDGYCFPEFEFIFSSKGQEQKRTFSAVLAVIFPAQKLLDHYLTIRAVCSSKTGENKGK